MPREPHVHVVARAQVDLGRAARALGDDDLEARRPGRRTPHAQPPPGDGDPSPSLLEETSPAGWPISTTWLRRSEPGLSSTGFIAGSGVTRAASACTHCARPISAVVPSAPRADHRVVRHVLGLVRRHADPATCERAAQPGGDHALAGVGGGAGDEQPAHSWGGHAGPPSTKVSSSRQSPLDHHCRSIRSTVTRQRQQVGDGRPDGLRGDRVRALVEGEVGRRVREEPATRRRLRERLGEPAGQGAQVVRHRRDEVEQPVGELAHGGERHLEAGRLPRNRGDQGEIGGRGPRQPWAEHRDVRMHEAGVARDEGVVVERGALAHHRIECGHRDRQHGVRPSRRPQEVARPSPSRRPPWHAPARPRASASTSPTRPATSSSESVPEVGAPPDRPVLEAVEVEGRATASPRGWSARPRCRRAAAARS